MTMTMVEPGVLLAEAATLLSTRLQVSGAESTDPAPVTDPAALVPGPGAVAVEATVTGTVTGAVMLLVGSRLHDTLAARGDATRTLTEALAAVVALIPGAEVTDARPSSPDRLFDGFGQTPGLHFVSLAERGRQVASLALAGDAHRPHRPHRRRWSPPRRPPSPTRRWSPPARCATSRTPTGPATRRPDGGHRRAGRTHMTVQNLLGLTPGAVVELDRAAGSPVDILVNGTLIARGEVVVIDEEFGVRVSEIVGPEPGDAQRERIGAEDRRTLARLARRRRPPPRLRRPAAPARRSAPGRPGPGSSTRRGWSRASSSPAGRRSSWSRSTSSACCCPSRAAAAVRSSCCRHSPSTRCPPSARRPHLPHARSRRCSRSCGR